MEGKRTLDTFVYDLIKQRRTEGRDVGDVLSMLLHAQDEGKMMEARRLYGESLLIKKRLGDQRGIATTLGNLGLLAEEEGNKTEAAPLFREALRIFEKLGSPWANKVREDLARLEGESD